MKPVRRYLRIIAFVLYLAAIAVVCFMKADELRDIPTTWMGLQVDKIAHFIMFLPFPILAYLALSPSGAGFIKKMLVLTLMAGIGLCIAYGTERIQYALGYRSYDLEDLRADTIGLSIGYAISTIGIMTSCIRSRSRKKSRKRS